MSFHSSNFVGFFLVAFLVYWALPSHRRRLLWLVGASAYFYMSWSAWFLLLMLASTSVDFLVAIRLTQTDRPRTRKLLVALSVIVNLSILAAFKYAAFALGSAQSVTHWLGWEVSLPVVKMILPLGISFYTFEAISYVVDVYRRQIEAVRRPLDYALYILFFPHLVAGPVVRPGEFLPQLSRPKRFDWQRCQLGARLFLIGLFKKVVIADSVAACIDPVFSAPGSFGTVALWLAVLGYAVQIYCDFSGYTDMALGIAHTLGFKLPPNFDAPYLATSPADFWRRWHMSLSRWLRDYLYLPLGGNRHGRWRTMFNLFVVMLLGGLWHGANWTFVIWGAYHGALLAIQRATPKSWGEAIPRPFAIGSTFLAICVGWIFFRAQTLADAWTILRRLFVPSLGTSLDFEARAIVLMALAGTFVGHVLHRYRLTPRFVWGLPAPVAGAALAMLFTLTLLLMPGDGKAFIYFQF